MKKLMLVALMLFVTGVFAKGGDNPIPPNVLKPCFIKVSKDWVNASLITAIQVQDNFRNGIHYRSGYGDIFVETDKQNKEIELFLKEVNEKCK